MMNEIYKRSAIAHSEGPETPWLPRIYCLQKMIPVWKRIKENNYQETRNEHYELCLLDDEEPWSNVLKPSTQRFVETYLNQMQTLNK